MKRCFLLFSLLQCATLLHAQELKPFVRGSQQSIVASHQGAPFVMALWSVDCSHCIDDMELLGRLVKKYRNFDLVLISTDTIEQKSQVNRMVHRYFPGRIESWVFADGYAERLRFELDPQWYGELPRTYFFDKEGHSTPLSGKIDADQLERWIRVNRGK